MQQTKFIEYVFEKSAKNSLFIHVEFAEQTKPNSFKINFLGVDCGPFEYQSIGSELLLSHTFSFQAKDIKDNGAFASNRKEVCNKARIKNVINLQFSSWFELELHLLKPEHGIVTFSCNLKFDFFIFSRFTLFEESFSRLHDLLPVKVF